MTSFWDITDAFLHILVEYTLPMKNQLDAVCGGSLGKTSISHTVDDLKVMGSNPGQIELRV